MRSRRFVSREKRDLHRETLVSPLPELGLVAADGPLDPDARARHRRRHRRPHGRSTRRRVRRDRPLRRRARARSRGRGRGHGPRRHGARADARRHRRAARRARPPRARPHPGKARARHRPPRPGRAHARAEEAPRPPRALEPGARDQPQGEPGAARGGRGRGGAARVRRDRDHGRRRPLRAAERDRAPRRLADGPARRDDAVRGRGAAEPRARDPRPRHVRRDALGLRDRARLRGRRRHALVEGVPRRRVRVPRRQGALHLRHGLRGADGLRAGPLDALSRGALPRSRARSGLAGSAERVDLVRRARALRARRHARDPRRERARCMARPRGRVRQRRHRLALGDPQDREADGAVPPGHGLRHLRVLGDAEARQHVRRRELRRRRPGRMAHGSARLAGGRGDRAGLGGGGSARTGASGARRAGGVRGARPPARVERGGRRGDDRLRLERDARPRPSGRRRSRRRAPGARGLRPGRRPRARPAGVRRDRGGRPLDAAPASLRRLPADLGRDRRRRASSTPP